MSRAKLSLSLARAWHKRVTADTNAQRAVKFVRSKVTHTSEERDPAEIDWTEWLWDETGTKCWHKHVDQLPPSAAPPTVAATIKHAVMRITTAYRTGAQVQEILEQLASIAVIRVSMLLAAEDDVVSGTESNGPCLRKRKRLSLPETLADAFPRAANAARLEEMAIRIATMFARGRGMAVASEHEVPASLQRLQPPAEEQPQDKGVMVLRGFRPPMAEVGTIGGIIGEHDDVACAELHIGPMSAEKGYFIAVAAIAAIMRIGAAVGLSANEVLVMKLDEVDPTIVQKLMSKPPGDKLLALLEQHSARYGVAHSEAQTDELISALDQSVFLYYRASREHAQSHDLHQDVRGVLMANKYVNDEDSDAELAEEDESVPSSSGKVTDDDSEFNEDELSDSMTSNSSSSVSLASECEDGNCDSRSDDVDESVIGSSSDDSEAASTDAGLDAEGKGQAMSEAAHPMVQATSRRRPE